MVQLFGYLLAGGVLLSSLLMLALGGRFQQVEQAAYAGAAGLVLGRLGRPHRALP